MITWVWALFVVGSILLMDVVRSVEYGVIIPLAFVALALAAPRQLGVPRARGKRMDRRDLAVIGLSYLAVVGLFRLGFGVFTADQVAGLFLSFGIGLALGVGVPVVYTVWIRHRRLATLGLGLQNLRRTMVLAVLFAGVQFAITLRRLEFPEPVDWVPLLVMALTVGVFESVFFRGFIQGRLEAAFGVGPSVLGAAGLYALYHVGYGMGAEETVFLFGLGVVYASAYRLTENVLVLWPLLTPLGSFFAQLRSGELSGELPWASILGFADVLGVMVAIIWLAHRRERRRPTRYVRLRDRGEGSRWIIEPRKVIETEGGRSADVKGSG